MKKSIISRREFVKNTSIGMAGTAVAGKLLFATGQTALSANSKPAVLGGSPSHSGAWPDWPLWDPAKDEAQILQVLRSGIWSRDKLVAEFEKKWAEMLGVKRCLATTNGTHALISGLKMLGIGAGDEVITTPYTFIATIDAIILCNAMPVFVDVDQETFQLDPQKIEAKITPRTRAIIPVHILGLPVDMDRIMTIAKKYDLIVLEDACQAHLAEFDSKKTGAIGHAGCFSFQTSKNLPLGEGGALVSDDEDLMDRAFSFHNFGRPYGRMVGDVSGEYVMVGTKCRATEYQAAIGLAQMERLERQTEERNQNAVYLRAQIEDIPGILPYRLYDKVNRATYHLFPFRFKKEYFNNLSRKKFIQALRAEGIPCSSGYTPLNTMPYLKDALASRVFKAVYPAEELDYAGYLERNRCPENDQLCEEAVWLPQNVLLGTKTELDDIAAALEKIHNSAGEINRKV